MCESSDCEFSRIVAFIDILGTSEILKHGDKTQLDQYIDGIEGLYSKIRDQVPIENLKMFSDNILIYTDGTTQENIESLLESVAMIQLYLIQEFNLFIRGGVVSGVLNHIPKDADDFIVGSAIVDAHHIESHVAIYPRVVVSNDILQIYDPISKTIPIVKDDWDQPFIDYLSIVEIEGFVDNSQLEAHRNALIKHIHDDSLMKECSVDGWDRIRNKDLWALSYHNDFCYNHDMHEYAISFIEEYSREAQKIIIRIIDKGLEVENDAI